MQIYDQIYQENFERARKEEEERARAAAMREQQAAWGGPPPGGPPGLQNPGWGANPAGNGWQGVHPLGLAWEHLPCIAVEFKTGVFTLRDASVPLKRLGRVHKMSSCWHGQGSAHRGLTWPAPTEVAWQL